MVIEKVFSYNKEDLFMGSYSNRGKEKRDLVKVEEIEISKHLAQYISRF